MWRKSCNYGVTCEDEAKRRNFGAKIKTFEENCYLPLYAVSSKEDTAYQRKLITRIRVMINSRSGVSLITYTPYAQLVISQRYAINVIDEEEAEDDDDPNMIDDVPEIFKIEDNLFNFDTPLWIKTYDEYEQELNNDKTRGLDEQWSENRVPYQLCDHISKPYHFKNGITKWLTCSSDTDGYCNGGELPGMVRVGRMTYFQNHKWYDNLIDWCLKQETLMYKARIEGSWGDATPGVMKFCAWLKNSFENFHELNYDVLVKLEECWWKVNTDEEQNLWCMTWSSTKELLTPFENLERVLRSRRKLFETPSLPESNSPEFDQISEIEEHIEEEEGQFLKELHDNTFSGSEHEDENKHIEKVLEIVDLFHISNVTQDQSMLRAFPVSLTGAASHWLRSEPTGSITTWEQEPDESLFCAWERFKELLMKCHHHYLTGMQEVILFYNGLDVPTRQILDSRGSIPTKTVVDANVAIQEMVEYSQKWHNGTSLKNKSTETSDGLAAIQAQLNSLGREINKLNEKVYAAQVGCELCKGPHYTKDCPHKEEGKTLEEAYYTQFGTPY
ncbi:reverse transcriptase domain-containing protein [Tanacetum coccineum]|uniref:Reverse transcriptase domain-containing protein n=1 Tax=Tanacetum coccineum TaxID=301880 RepID=A0ABQ5AX21_9ASTR